MNLRAQTWGRSTLLFFEGVMDSLPVARDFLATDTESVLIDVSEVRRANSHGVLLWCRFLRDLKVGEYALAGLRPPLVRQLNMVSAFGGRAQIASVFVPYFCAVCQRDVQGWFDLAKDFSLVGMGQNTWAAPICPQCGGQTDFDGEPTYFSFTRQYGRPALSVRLRALLAVASREASVRAREST